MSAGDTQQDWIAQAVGGDQLALERLLLEQYASLSRHIAAKLTGPPARLLGADDIVQETYVHAMRGIRRCQARTKAAFAAWLKTIADNCLRDALKRLGRKKRGGGLPQAGGAAADADGSMVELVELLSAGSHRPERSVARREAVQAVQVGLACLPEDQREAVRLRCLVGKSVEETAAAMGRTPGAVRGLLQRAKQALRETLVRSTLWFSRK